MEDKKLRILEIVPLEDGTEEEIPVKEMIIPPTLIFLFLEKKITYLEYQLVLNDLFEGWIIENGLIKTDYCWDDDEI